MNGPGWEQQQWELEYQQWSEYYDRGYVNDLEKSYSDKENGDMKVSEVYQSSSKSLKAEDLQGSPRKVIVSGWKTQEFDGRNGKETKIVLSFEDKEKTLVCNVTNSRIIAAQFGEELDDWVGKEIILYPTKVDFGGEMVDAIRVREVVPDPDDDLPF